MLTERQAWLKIAKACDAGSKDEDGYFSVGGVECSGICPAVEYVGVGINVADRMREKISRNAPPAKYGVGRHRWRVGDFASRAAFCRNMAALCAKRKPAKAR